MMGTKRKDKKGKKKDAPAKEQEKKEAGEVCIFIDKRRAMKKVNQSDPVIMRINDVKTEIPLNKKVVVPKNVASCLKDCGIPYQIIEIF